MNKALIYSIFFTICATVTQIGYYWKGAEVSQIASIIWTALAIISISFI